MDHVAPEDFGAVADRAVTLSARASWKLAAIVSVGAILTSFYVTFQRFEEHELEANGRVAYAALTAVVLAFVLFNPLFAAQSLVLARVLLRVAGCIDVELRTFSEIVRAYARYAMRYFATSLVMVVVLFLSTVLARAEWSSVDRVVTWVTLAPFVLASLAGTCLCYSWFWQTQVTAAAGVSKPIATARGIVWRRKSRFASVVMGGAVGLAPFLVGLVFRDAFGSAALSGTIVTAVLHDAAAAFGSAVCVVRYRSSRASEGTVRSWP